MINQTVSLSWQEDAGSSLRASVNLSDAQSVKADVAAPSGSSADAALAIDPARTSLLLILSNADVTLQSGGTDEVQAVAETGTPAPGDTITLGYDGVNAAYPVAYNATAAAVLAALQTIPALAGNVAVSGPAGGPWVVTFGNALGRGPRPMLSGLFTTTGTLALAITRTTAGVAPAESLAVKGSLPILWFSGCGMGFPFASAVSSLRVVNSSGQQATAKIRALSHP